jgi:hypothetical protein
MDAEILHAIWFDCKDLSDSQHKLLLALAYHCHHSLTCFPSIPRLAVMIRKKPRQTRTLLRDNRIGLHLTFLNTLLAVFFLDDFIVRVAGKLV